MGLAWPRHGHCMLCVNRPLEVLLPSNFSLAYFVMNIGGQKSTRVTTGWLSPQDDSGQHLNIFVYSHFFTYCQISRDSVLEASVESGQVFPFKIGGGGGGVEVSE
jgi:hypothetical protein